MSGINIKKRRGKKKRAGRLEAANSAIYLGTVSAASRRGGDGVAARWRRRRGDGLRQCRSEGRRLWSGFWKQKGFASRN
nr:hypothetical protein Itr_chr04CG23690 [Ipomoea trifida]